MPSPIYADLDFSVPRQTGVVEFKYHNSNDPSAGRMVLRKFVVYAANYTDPVVGSTDPVWPSYKLVGRSDPTRVGEGGLLEFTNTYSNTPVEKPSWGSEELTSVQATDEIVKSFMTTPGYDRSRIPAGANNKELVLPGAGYTTQLGGIGVQLVARTTYITPAMYKGAGGTGPTFVYENTSFNAQIAVVWWFNIGDTIQLRSPRNVGTKTLREYFQTESPETIPLLQFGDPYTAGYKVIRASSLDLYMGNIWRRTTTLVRSADLEAATLSV